MRIVVAGSSGLIGTALVESLRSDEHDVVRLVRREPSAPDEVRWDPTLGARAADDALKATVDDADAVVNLAGAGVAEKRWNEAHRRAILESRVSATTALATAIAETAHRPRVFVSGSASGFYGDTGPIAVDESAPRGSTFLSGVCVAWELAAEPARDAGVRVVHPRTGTVTDRDGGAFGRLLPVIKVGAGGRLGSGRQWWSLISLHDEVAGIRHVIEHEAVSGPVNFAAPEQVTNGDLTNRLGAALHRPTLAIVPGFALHAVLGEFAAELLIDQCMAPAALLASGFEFTHPTVDSMIADLLAH
jgi:uncharacterized protein (TIGR01777 family)